MVAQINSVFIIVILTKAATVSVHTYNSDSVDVQRFIMFSAIPVAIKVIVVTGVHTANVFMTLAPTIMNVPFNVLVFNLEISLLRVLSSLTFQP